MKKNYAFKLKHVRYRCLFFFFSLFLITAGLFSCQEQTPVLINDNIPVNNNRNNAPPVSSTWVLDVSVSDEFNTMNTSKWGTTLWYDVSSDFAFNPSNTTVSNGCLQLTAKKQTLNNKNFTCGVAKSTFQVGGDSYIEIRAKTIDYRANVTTAIWLSDLPIAANNPNIEIDLMETLSAGSQPKQFVSTIHQWFVPGGDVSPRWKIKDLPYNLSDDFHIYALERRNGYIRFYLDGVVYWEFETSKYPGISEQDRNIVFSIEGHAGTPNETYLPANFLVDYVRVYHTTNQSQVTYGNNIVANPGFESGEKGNPIGWNVYGSNPGAIWVYADGGHTGTRKLVFGSANPFNLSVSQHFYGLPTGVYQLEAWTTKVGSFNDCKIYAKSYGGVELTSPVKLNSVWNKVIIDNIYVDNGECEIGLGANSNGGAGISARFDDVKFYKIGF